MKIIHDINEWNNFAVNRDDEPSKFPVLAWNVLTDFFMGEANVSHFVEIPTGLLKSLDGSYLDIWIDGFKKGKEYNE